MHRHVAIQRETFDSGAEQAALRAAAPHAGAVVAFIGLVRDQASEQAVHGLVLEHYPGMTERSVDAVVDTAADRWALEGIRVVHRVGELDPGEPIVLVSVAASHRDAAFEACRLLIDYLKTRAIFWKKERYADDARWVEATVADHAAAQEWACSSSDSHPPSSSKP